MPKNVDDKITTNTFQPGNPDQTPFSLNKPLEASQGQLVFCTGGCRSGKSSFAQSWVEEHSKNRCYIATLEVNDQEMARRVSLHQKSRGTGWRTIEIPITKAFQLEEAVSSAMEAGEGILLDCLGTWVSACWVQNSWEKKAREDRAHQEGKTDELERACAIYSELESKITETLKKALILLSAYARKGHPVALVSIEVGLGLVPVDVESRAYRDMLGRVNQLVGKFADSAFFLVSGMPLRLK